MRSPTPDSVVSKVERIKDPAERAVLRAERAEKPARKGRSTTLTKAAKTAADA